MGIPWIATARQRRKHYREQMLKGFDALSDFYYTYWGEYFHLAVYEPDDDPADVATAYEKTHERYFEALKIGETARILDVACGGGALSTWLAERTTGEVVGVDLSNTQLAHARKRLFAGRPNLRFIQHDVMHIAELAEAAFDAAICLDAACYLPDRPAALRGIATLLRPGGRLLLVDWCRIEHPTKLQDELILEPLRRYWAIADLETTQGYQKAFRAAGFRVHEIQDLSTAVLPNWERGYQAALRALAEPVRLSKLLRLAARHGPLALTAAKDQFQVALLAKAAGESGLLRYVSVLAERTET